jgi:outer membrane protein TolC
VALPKLDRSALLADAFAKRYDYQQAVLEAEAQDIRLRFARNQALPQLDLVASYALNGLAGSLGSSYEESFSGASPEWSLGVNLRIPLGNIQGRATVEQARTQKEQAILRIKQIELNVAVDVDTVISRIETNRQRRRYRAHSRELFEEACGSRSAGSKKGRAPAST